MAHYAETAIEGLGQSITHCNIDPLVFKNGAKSGFGMCFGPTSFLGYHSLFGTCHNLDLRCVFGPTSFLGTELKHFPNVESRSQPPLYFQARSTARNRFTLLSPVR